MEKTAILVASYGTTHPDALENCIAATEYTIAARFPDCAVYRAFTGRMVSRLLEQRGLAVDDLSAALYRAAADGCTRAVIQPTHIADDLAGKMEKTACPSGLQVALGRPLLGSDRDCDALAAHLVAQYPLAEGEALLLMGHGSETGENRVYHRLQAALEDHYVVAMLEGQPDFEAAVAWLKASGAKRVRVLPLLFVAGSHAKKNMAGEFCDLVRAAGMEAVPLLRGLGEDPAIRAMYADRAAEALRR